MTEEVFNAYRADGWHIFKLIKTTNGDGNAVKGLYKTPKGWNDPNITCTYQPKAVYGGVPPKDIVAIDYDVKGGKKIGDKSFEKLQKDLGMSLDTCVNTPSGGGHSYLRLYNLPEETPKLKKIQKKYPDIDFQSHLSEFVVLGGQTIEGYGEYKFVDEDFEYFVNDNPNINLSILETRASRVQGDGYDEIDDFAHITERPSKDEVLEMIFKLDPSGEYETWQQVAMALNSWDLNGDEGEKIFVDWSLSSTAHVGRHGKQSVIEQAKTKYSQSVADTPSFYKKLFTFSNEADETDFDTRITKAETENDLDEVAESIKYSKISNIKREAYVEKLCTKSKELTGKPEKVKFKKAVKFLDKKKVEERQEKAESSGLPDWQYSKEGVVYMPTYANMVHFLEHISDENIKYDEILKEIIVNDNYNIVTGINGITRSKIMDEVMRFGISKSIVTEHYDQAIFSKKVNGLMEYIEELGDWDGETDYIGKVSSTISTSISSPEYVKEVMKCFCIQAIAAWDNKRRTNYKLSKLESVMAFVGRQGIGKTTWVSSLMPEKMAYYFKEGVELDPSNKDSYIEATKAGLVELGELDATNRKSDISSLKAFLSKNVDEFRAPYGRSSEKYARQTVYVGTVNNPDFLKDATGSRRFMVLDVEDLKLPDTEDVKGMWVQALALYLQGHNWLLSGSFAKQREVINEQFTDIGHMGEIVDKLVECIAKSEGVKRQYRVSGILEKLGEHKPTSRERSDFIALMNKVGIKCDNQKRYTLPEDVFTIYNLEDDTGFTDLDEL